jgi:hypothetical protein
MRNIDFNKYQSALIIGNGFDLSLGLSTSYMDFVNSDEFQILLNMQNQLAIYLKVNAELQNWYLQPIITQYFIDNKSEIWLLFLIAHSKR